MFTRDWLFWLIAIAVVAIPNLLGRLRSAGKRKEQPAAPPARPRPKQPSRPQSVSRGKPAPEISGKPQVATDRLRDVLRQLEQTAREEIQGVLRQPGQPERPPVPRVPAVAAAQVAGRKPSPAAKPSSLSPPPAAPVQPQPRRASAWSEALRDRQNLRRIIISAEIIGPPKGA